MKYVLITGVSSGIGAVTTEYLLSQGYHVFGSVRTAEDARRCQGDFGDAFTPLIFDVRNIDKIRRAVDVVRREIGARNLAAVVNNAGIAVSGPIQFIEPEEIQAQFDINVIGLINVTQAFLPLLGGRIDNIEPPGRLINMSSVAGTFTMPMQAPYSASKHAVESLTDAMRREVDTYGIKVISIRPGPIKSEIWHKELAKTKKYDGTIYERIWDKKNTLISEKAKSAAPTIFVAKAVAKAIETRYPKLHYLVYGNLFSYYLIRLLPSRWVDIIIRKQFKKLSK